MAEPGAELGAELRAELWFVTGGARSGKSRFAERLAAETGREVVYIATMEPLDQELVERVAAHRASRPAGWSTLEAPLDPAGALAGAAPAACAIIDCLSLWVSNRLGPLGRDPLPAAVARLERELEAEVERLLDAARAREVPAIVVTNEVGSGVVPPTRSAGPTATCSGGSTSGSPSQQTGPGCSWPAGRWSCRPRSGLASSGLVSSGTRATPEVGGAPRGPRKGAGSRRASCSSHVGC